jgi:uncharacterized membrane protein
MRITKLRVVAGVLLASSAAFLTYTSMTQYVAVTADANGELCVSGSAIHTDQAQVYCYTDDAGKKLRFILARGNDGKVRSAFDACRQCFMYHRGYRIADGELICRVCGNHYSIDHMTEGKASCVPVSLAHEDGAGVVHIKASDVRSGSSLF